MADKLTMRTAATRPQDGPAVTLSDKQAFLATLEMMDDWKGEEDDMRTFWRGKECTVRDIRDDGTCTCVFVYNDIEYPEYFPWTAIRQGDARQEAAPKNNFKVGRVQMLQNSKSLRAAFARVEGDERSGISEEKMFYCAYDAELTAIYADGTVTCLFDDGKSFDFPFEAIKEQLSIKPPLPGWEILCKYVSVNMEVGLNVEALGVLDKALNNGELLRSFSKQQTETPESGAAGVDWAESLSVKSDDMDPSDRQDRLSKLFAVADRDGDGVLDFNELFARLKTLELIKKENFANVKHGELIFGVGDAKKVKGLFKNADKDGNGLISLGELKAVFQELGEMSDNEIKDLFDAADVNHDGYLNYEAFIDWLNLEGVSKTGVYHAVQVKGAAGFYDAAIWKRFLAAIKDDQLKKECEIKVEDLLKTVDQFDKSDQCDQAIAWANGVFETSVPYRLNSSGLFSCMVILAFALAAQELNDFAAQPNPYYEAFVEEDPVAGVRAVWAEAKSLVEAGDSNAAIELLAQPQDMMEKTIAMQFESQPDELEYIRTNMTMVREQMRNTLRTVLNGDDRSLTFLDEARQSFYKTDTFNFNASTHQPGIPTMIRLAGGAWRVHFSDPRTQSFW